MTAILASVMLRHVMGVAPPRGHVAPVRHRPALLMDGDGQGPREFRAAWEALRHRFGALYTAVFAAEERLRRPEWRNFVSEPRDRCQVSQWPRSGAEAVAVQKPRAMADAALQWPLGGTPSINMPSIDS